jgi:hypothetical protein
MRAGNSMQSFSMTPDQNHLPEYKHAAAEAGKLLEKPEQSLARA